MSTVIVIEKPNIVNLTSAEVMIARAFNRRDEWSLEIVFKGGVTVTTPATVDEINAIESELADTEGWRVNPSLYNNGFSARRLEVVADDPIPFHGQPCYEVMR